MICLVSLADILGHREPFQNCVHLYFVEHYLFILWQYGGQLVAVQAESHCLIKIKNQGFDILLDARANFSIIVTMAEVVLRKTPTLGPLSVEPVTLSCRGLTWWVMVRASLSPSLFWRWLRKWIICWTKWQPKSVTKKWKQTEASELTYNKQAKETELSARGAKLPPAATAKEYGNCCWDWMSMTPGDGMGTADGVRQAVYLWISHTFKAICFYLQIKIIFLSFYEMLLYFSCSFS